jgi:hypothetical protein
MRTLGFTILCALAVWAQAPVNCPGPLSEIQMADLIRNHVPEERLRTFVMQCGVDFPLTQEVEKRLRLAGATPSVIAALQKNPPKQQSTQLKTEAPPPSVELAFWNTIKDEKGPKYFQAYLDRYPNGEFAEIARLKLVASAPSTQEGKPPLTTDSAPHPTEPSTLRSESIQPQPEPGVSVQHYHYGFGLDGHAGSWIGNGRDCRGTLVITPGWLLYKSPSHSLEVGRETIKSVQYRSGDGTNNWVSVHLSAGRFKNYDFTGPSSILDELRAKWKISLTRK